MRSIQKVTENSVFYFGTEFKKLCFFGELLDYTSRARWPEGLIVLRSFKSLRYTQTDSNLVTLDGVTIAKTRFIVTKFGRVTLWSRFSDTRWRYHCEIPISCH